MNEYDAQVLQNSNSKVNTQDIDELIYEESEKSQALSHDSCGACQRKGFPLFLVRKSVVPKANYNIF